MTNVAYEVCTVLNFATRSFQERFSMIRASAPKGKELAAYFFEPLASLQFVKPIRNN